MPVIDIRWWHVARARGRGLLGGVDEADDAERCVYGTNPHRSRARRVDRGAGNGTLNAIRRAATGTIRVTVSAGRIEYRYRDLVRESVDKMPVDAEHRAIDTYPSGHSHSLAVAVGEGEVHAVGKPIREQKEARNGKLELKKSHLAVTAVAVVSARVAAVSDAKLTPGCRASGWATTVAIECIKPSIRGESDNGDLVDSRTEQKGGRT